MTHGMSFDMTHMEEQAGTIWGNGSLAQWVPTWPRKGTLFHPWNGLAKNLKLFAAPEPKK